MHDDETENKASERRKTREWIRRRQESGYLRNIVRELAAEHNVSLSPDNEKEIRRLHRDIRRIRSGYYARFQKDGTALVFDKVISAGERLTLLFLGSKQTVSMVMIEIAITMRVHACNMLVETGQMNKVSHPT